MSKYQDGLSTYLVVRIWASKFTKLPYICNYFIHFSGQPWNEERTLVEFVLDNTFLNDRENCMNYTC